LATEKVIPFPKKPSKIAPERIRPELNLEKWAIWQPSKSKNRPVERRLRREVTLADGKRVIAEVEVGYTNKGMLTTEDQKTYYALIKHWEGTGKLEDRPIFFSLKHLAKLLEKKWGSNVIEALTQSLTRLRITPLIWTNSYQDSQTHKTVEVIEPFNILSDLKIVRSRTDGHITKQAGYFRFNDYIIKNLHANLTKPLLFETVINFKSEVAQILYTYLDLILADKTLFERRTNELFEDLGLEGKAYRNPSNRKQVLDRALTELSGAPLTTGRIASATLEETVDGKDNKIVIRKGKLVALPTINHYQEDQSSEPSADQLPADSREAAATEPPQEQRPDHEQLLTQARELVAYFYEVFHTGKNFQISSKATAQAISLITQYGFEEAKYIVDFAHREAPKTNYDIQTFGGIIQYSSRALAEYEQRRADQHHAQQSREAIEACGLCDQYGMRRLGENTVKRCTHDQAIEEAAAREFAETERQQQEEQRREAEADQRAGQYLDQLPQEEYQALFAQVQAEALKQYPSLKRMPDDTRQQMIRRLMIRKVRAEQASETTRETHQEGSNEPQDAAPDQPIG